VGRIGGEKDGVGEEGSRIDAVRRTDRSGEVKGWGVGGGGGEVCRKVTQP